MAPPDPSQCWRPWRLRSRRSRPGKLSTGIQVLFLAPKAPETMAFLGWNHIFGTIEWGRLICLMLRIHNQVTRFPRSEVLRISEDPKHSIHRWPSQYGDFPVGIPSGSQTGYGKCTFDYVCIYIYIVWWCFPCINFIYRVDAANSRWLLFPIIDSFPI